MPTSPHDPPGGTAHAPGRRDRGGQRFGRVTGGPAGSYRVRDDDSGVIYWCGHTDIVTEGLRALSAGERVRFLTDHADPGHAIYVIRLDLPDVEEYYP